uniref:Eukaryotic translation initiation factor 3 30 kDa subunit n=1 Tax=Phlebotomus papatasi TaxID=29031 RepID=A0A1B0DHT5_PHLPP
MEDDWEQIAEKIDRVTIPPKNPNINKWEGEDEEDDVKDSWEDDEEKKDEEKVETKVTRTKPKKNLQEKIAEKESHCNEIRENKLEDYRKELESQQVEFLEKKIKNLEFIKKEQETLKLPQTVTEEQINQARQKLSQAIMQQKATTAASKGH